MACSKCNKVKCCCKIVISRKGLRGGPGKKGAIGPGAPIIPLNQVVGQSAFFATLNGAIGAVGVGTEFPNLNNNFFNSFPQAPKLYSLSVSFHAVSTLQHTLKMYFKKNGVQVSQTYHRTLFPKDFCHFETELLQFTNTDLLSLYVESTSVDCVIAYNHLTNFRII